MIRYIIIYIYGPQPLQHFPIPDAWQTLQMVGHSLDGFWFMVFGSWFVVYGLRFMVLWFLVYDIMVEGVFGLLLMVPGFRCLMHGLWFMVNSFWCMVQGLWFLVNGVWFMVHYGAW